jgi:PhnB protein
MTTVNVYLTFKGNCEEAFNFYKSVFGGDFGYIGRFKDMPPVDGKSAPAGTGDKIMHVSLPVSKETVLKGSDTIEGFSPPVTFGNNFGISINTDSQAEADKLFNAFPREEKSACQWATLSGALISECSPTSTESTGW